MHPTPYRYPCTPHPTGNHAPHTPQVPRTPVPCRYHAPSPHSNHAPTPHKCHAPCALQVAMHLAHQVPSQPVQTRHPAKVPLQSALSHRKTVSTALVPSQPEGAGRPRMSGAAGSPGSVVRCHALHWSPVGQPQPVTPQWKRVLQALGPPWPLHVSPESALGGDPAHAGPHSASRWPCRTSPVAPSATRPCGPPRPPFHSHKPPAHGSESTLFRINNHLELKFKPSYKP